MNVYIAELRTPVLKSFPTLDALLAYQLTQQYDGDWEKAINDVPIKRLNGLFYCSSAIIENPTPYNRCFIGGLQATHRLSTEMVKLNKKGLHGTISKNRRQDFGNVENSYSGLSGVAVWWFFDGDPIAVKELMSGVQFIGTQRKAGYGELGERQMMTAKVSHKDLSGNPLRPIPRTQMSGGGIVIDAAWQPPYWGYDTREPCTSITQHYTTEMLEEMI